MVLDLLFSAICLAIISCVFLLEMEEIRFSWLVFCFLVLLGIEGKVLVRLVAVGGLLFKVSSDLKESG